MADPPEPEEYADEAFEPWLQHLVAAHRESRKTIERLEAENLAARNNAERLVAILTPLFVQAQEADSPDEEALGGALDVLTGWFGQNGRPLRRLDELQAGLDLEHDIQRHMLDRLGIAWTPGEPFYSLVEAELKRVEGLVERRDAEIVRLGNAWDASLAEVDRLKDLLKRMLASDDAVQMAWSKEIRKVLRRG